MAVSDGYRINVHKSALRFFCKTGLAEAINERLAATAKPTRPAPAAGPAKYVTFVPVFCALIHHYGRL